MGMSSIDPAGACTSNWTISPADWKASHSSETLTTVFDTIDDSTRATAIAITDLKNANAADKPPADT